MEPRKLTLAEVRWSVQSVTEFMGQLKDRLPADLPDDAIFALGQAAGCLGRALVALQAPDR